MLRVCPASGRVNPKYSLFGLQRTAEYSCTDTIKVENNLINILPRLAENQKTRKGSFSMSSCPVFLGKLVKCCFAVEVHLCQFCSRLFFSPDRSDQLSHHSHSVPCNNFNQTVLIYHCYQMNGLPWPYVPSCSINFSLWSLL